MNPFSASTILMGLCLMSLLGPISTASAATITFEGELASSDGGGLGPNVSVSVNGVAARLNDQGEYRGQLPQGPIYQVVIEGEAVYRAIQTFAMTELYSEDCECLRVPRIEVVERKPGRIELFFAGDVMAGRRYVEPIWGERQLIDPADPLPDMLELLAPMKPYIESADFASANLEIVLSEQEFANSPPKSVVFYAHPALATALKQAGFDHVSLGNNHSYDYLEEGLVTTIEAVESVGLAWSGAGFNEAQALSASRLNVRSQDLCLLGYVGWKGRVEPNQVAEADKGGAAYGSEENIASSVTREAGTGCTVIAQYHGSREYSDGPTEESERRMKLAVDKGAGLIASHHPHVAQGVELYKDALIVYSSGNFLFDQYFLETHGSFALKVWLDEGRFSRAEIIPLRILDYRPVPGIGSMREAILGRVTGLSRKHGTHVDRNGGHGLITAGGYAQTRDSTPTDEHSTSLFGGGDFESAQYGEVADRSLKAEGGKIDYHFVGAEGHFLRMTSEQAGDAVHLTTSTFFRVVPGKRVTVSGKVRGHQPFKLEVSSQQRPANMNRFVALEQSPFERQVERSFASGDEWQEFTLSFDLDHSDGVRPFRPRFEFSAIEPHRGRAFSIDLDDLRIAVHTP